MDQRGLECLTRYGFLAYNSLLGFRPRPEVGGESGLSKNGYVGKGYLAMNDCPVMQQHRWAEEKEPD